MNSPESLPIPPPSSALDRRSKLRGGVSTESIYSTSTAAPIKTFLDYGFMGAPPQEFLVEHMAWALKRGIRLQLGFEPQIPLLAGETIPPGFLSARGNPRLVQLNLTQLKAMLLDSSRQDFLSVRFRTNLERWGKLIASHKDWIILRPISEMNENTSRWQIGHPDNKKTGRPAHLLAECWILLRDYFRARKVSNVQFAFCPLTHQNNYNSQEKADPLLAALKLISPRDIDYLGLNVYTTAFTEENSFQSLVSPWKKWMDEVLPGTPWIVGEMGIGQYNAAANQTIQEVYRQQWIKEAFFAARALDFEQVTLFNRSQWQLRNSESERVLAQAIVDFQA